MSLLSDLVIKIFEENPSTVFRINDIIKETGLSRDKRNEIKKILKELAFQYKIKELRNNHFLLFKETEKLIGRISISDKGFGFVKTHKSDKDGDVFIPRNAVKDSMDGDLVEVSITKTRRDEKLSFEGSVVKIIERGKTLIVGRFYRKPYGATIEPRDTSFKRKILISKKFKKNEIKDDTWVVVKITNFTPEPNPLIGQISEILGEDGDPGLDVMLLIRDYGVKPEFPTEVLEEADSFPDIIPEEELNHRLDLRKKRIFTIDPIHAKDFDDALSVEKVGQNKWRVGIHIADVVYYVSENSKLDKEALERGTSIYPVDRVIPMLPERLSNNLCSLNPNIDRLTVSVIADLDKDGKVLSATYHNSIINSVHRLNYQEVQKVFDEDRETLIKYSKIIDDLLLLKEITVKLRQNRIQKGALDLDIPETEVIMDERGVAIDIKPYERLESHKLVEECMLLANELVANHLIKQRIPTVFRIHETAEPAKLESLAPALKIFGLSLPSKEYLTTKTLQAALRQTQQRENGGIARRMILRALKRAKYSSINKGHFGLASEAYLHFTSPIRRYPDLVVHRILKEWIKNNNFPKDKIHGLENNLPGISYLCSEKEDRADLIERDTTRLKCLEFMKKYIGETFDGFILSMNRYSFAVELIEFPVEGRVFLKNVKSDFYKLDDTGFRLIGRKRKNVIRLGQKINVQIIRINLENVEMELRYIE